MYSQVVVPQRRANTPATYASSFRRVMGWPDTRLRDIMDSGLWGRYNTS